MWEIKDIWYTVDGIEKVKYMIYSYTINKI